MRPERDFDRPGVADAAQIDKDTQNLQSYVGTSKETLSRSRSVNCTVLAADCGRMTSKPEVELIR